MVVWEEGQMFLLQHIYLSLHVHRVAVSITEAAGTLEGQVEKACIAVSSWFPCPDFI